MCDSDGDKDTDCSDAEDKQTKATNYVSLFLATTYLCTMLALYLGGLFLELFPKTLLFKLTIILWLIPIGVVFILYEKRKKVSETYTNSFGETKKIPRCHYFRQKMKILRKYFVQGFIIKPAIFIFLVLLTPSIDSVMFSYQVSKLNFGPVFMSYIMVATYVVNILAVFIYRKFLVNTNLKKIITVTTIWFSLFNALRLLIIFGINEKVGISNHVFFTIIECLYSFANEIHLMPIMIMACRVCPKNMEATVFEMIMSIVNLGYLVSYQSGGFLAEGLGITVDNFDNLWIQVLVSSVFPWLVLWVVMFVPSDFAQQVEKFSKKMALEKQE